MENELRNDALRVQCETLLRNAKYIVSKCKEANAVNDQWFINWGKEIKELV